MNSPAYTSGEKGTPARPPISLEEEKLLAGVRRGDEGAFLELVNRYHHRLLRLARYYVRSRAAAEDVVQETWLAVLRGIERFEGRSSLKTWILRILMNRAKSWGEREGRLVPFSALAEAEADADEAAVDPERFLGPDSALPGHWSVAPRSWGENAEKQLLRGEAMKTMMAAIEALPKGQRMVITLRDVDGCTAEETCGLLGISEANQRVLLHRARSRVRRHLEQYFERT